MFWLTDHGDPSIVVHRISESEIQKLYSTDDRLNHVTKTRFLKSRKDRQMHYMGQMIGMNLVYQNGRSPGGTRTNWEMKEYRLVRDDVDQVGVAQVEIAQVKGLFSSSIKISRCAGPYNYWMQMEKNGLFQLRFRINANVLMYVFDRAQRYMREMRWDYKRGD